MDIANLQAFVSVAELASFSAAAEQLFLTQPAISKRIVSLEQELGNRLFDRIGRQVSLTEAGHALLPRARHILLEIEDSLRVLQNLSGTVTGTLRVATSHHIGLHRLPPVLRRYSKACPDVELDIHFMDSEQACRAIERGEMELGIVTLPLITPSQLQTRCIWPDPLDVAISRHHPLARRSKIDLTQLLDYPAILPAPGTYTREVFDQAVTPLAVEVRVSMTTNYLETIKMLVGVGLGWSLLPRTMFDQELCALAIPELSLQRRLGLIWHTERTLSNAAQAMLKEVTRDE